MNTENRWREISIAGGWKMSVFQLSVCAIWLCLFVWTVAFFLTTATQPIAGILSLTAERWLKRLLPRFLSLKFWISWMWSEIGFSKSWSSICGGRRGRGVSVREQLMEQHSTWKDRPERLTVSDNPSPPPARPQSFLLESPELSFSSSSVSPPHHSIPTNRDPSVHVKAYGFSSVYTSPTLCACIQEHSVSSIKFFCEGFLSSTEHTKHVLSHLTNH